MHESLILKIRNTPSLLVSNKYDFDFCNSQVPTPPFTGPHHYGDHRRCCLTKVDLKRMEDGLIKFVDLETGKTTGEGEPSTRPKKRRWSGFPNQHSVTYRKVPNEFLESHLRGSNFVGKIKSLPRVYNREDQESVNV